MLPEKVWAGINKIGNKTILNEISISKRNYASDASFESKPARIHLLDQGPSTKVSCTKDEALTFFNQMNVIRRIESEASSLYKEKMVRGFCHLYSGQEAIAVGMKAALRKNDALITSYRAHGWTYLFGATPVQVLSELTGRNTGCARGKGGSMHMYAPDFYGGNGIVGAQVPLGVGLAFAAKYNGTDNVSCALYGDGAANQGQIYEVFNIAKLWALPCIFVCENNIYGMGTPVSRAAANTEFFTRGDGVIPGIACDGMDVLAMREATRFCISHIKAGKGPILLEAITYRYFGHSMSDPGTSYRSRDEVQEVRETRDPINQFKKKIIEAKLVTAEELKKIEDDNKKTIADAAQRARTDKEIGVEELTYDIYSNNVSPEIRNRLPWNPLSHKRIGKAKNFK